MKHLEPEEINLVSLAAQYSNEDKARSLLESLRWPNGVVCPHCKNAGEKTISKVGHNAKSKTTARKGVYFCGACRKQFTVTVGTVFEGSHIPISKWLMAWFIICSSKKAISAHQLHRMLGLTYKSAWFMAHRLRFALGNDKPMLGGIVEADETFIGGKGDMRRKLSSKTPVVALIERDGKMRAQVVTSVSQHNLGKCLNDCVKSEAVLCTDEHAGYKPAGKKFAKHYSVVHSRKQYAKDADDGTRVHINTCESFFSLLKRGVHGAWHNVSREHLPKYANEFAFRWNHRKMTDGERMVAAVPFIEGARLMYRKPAN